MTAPWRAWHESQCKEEWQDLGAAEVPIPSQIRPSESAVVPCWIKRLVVIGLLILVLLVVVSLCPSFYQGLEHGESLLGFLGSDLESRQGAKPSPKSLLHARQDVHAPPPNRTSVLECLQVAQPVLMPYGAANSDGSTGARTGSGSSCTVTLMEHSFATSYGVPFVGNYTPPSCAFNRVVMNFTVVSRGRQFDRLALMYFGDTEVWRTSTAEPTSNPGIRWQVLKDMTSYMYLWKSPQTLIFDLGNLVNENYTAPFNTTLSATFFTADGIDTDTAPPADLIIPISSRLGSVNNSVSAFTVPKQNATNIVSNFPRNARRAVFSVSACGQATEEFWWSNVLQSDVFTFNSTAGQIPGYSPFREVQVLIDGYLAGVQWPFPVIFTGGVVPGLHRPIVGIDAFDLKEHEIDITPFLPMLSDGKAHNFTMVVVGLDDNGSTAVMIPTANNSWTVTGKVFVWLDANEGSITSGDMPTIRSSDPAITISRNLGVSSNGTNITLDFTTRVRRAVSITGRVVTGHGISTNTVSWLQQLTYTNIASILQSGATSVNNFTVTGMESASGLPDGQTYSLEYAYPLFVNSSTNVTEQGNVTLFAHMIASKQVQVSGPSVFPSGLEVYSSTRGKKFVAALMTTTKDGTSTFLQTDDGKNATGFGQSNQIFRFGGLTSQGSLFEDAPDVELYFRNITATNGSVSYDKEVSAGAVAANRNTGHASEAKLGENPGKVFAQAPLDAGIGFRSFLGRGAVGET